MGFSYVTVGTNDPAAARQFYAALARALDGSIVQDVPDRAFCCALPGEGRIWVTRPYDGEAATVGNGSTVALSCDGPERVDAAHAAGLEAGGTDEGGPGPRSAYGPDVYVAYLRDPDGNKLALVHYRATSN